MVSGAQAGDPSQGCESAGTSRLSQAKSGGEFARIQLIQKISAQRDDDATSFHDVRTNIALLSACYDARSGRQQTWLDGGAGLVLFGTSGAALSAGAGALTQGYWGAAGLAPGIISQFNAWEPTRDLYYAAGETLDFLSQRYLELNRATAAMANWDEKTTSTDCAERLRELNETVSGWGTADRALITPEVERLQVACHALVLEHKRLSLFTKAATEATTKSWIASGLAGDALRLDRQIRVQDRSLNYTPLQAVSMIAASPFLTVGSILSNEDSKSAVEALKAQKAVASLRITLSPLDLPTPPKLLAVPGPLALQARDRDKVPRSPRAKPTTGSVRDLLDDLTEVQEDLELKTEDHNASTKLAIGIADLSRPGVISARFDPETHAVSMTFTPTDGS